MAGWSGIKPTAFVKVVEADLKEKRNQIAAEALQMVVGGSPVDTGAYRGNHRVSVDVEDLGVDEGLSGENTQATISAGLAVIAQANQPYQAVIVQNNIAYGEDLENGHSKEQAPQGVYRPAFAHIRAKHGAS